MKSTTVDNIRSVWKKDSKTSISNPIVGLDFGTSNSCCAIWLPKDNRVKVVRNKEGKKLTPSTLVFNEANFTKAKVGVQERDFEIPVITSIKSMFGGRNTNNLAITSNSTGVFSLACSNISGESKDIDVAELCAFILRDLIQSAELYLTKHRVCILPSIPENEADIYRVKQAVIGIPVHFTETMKNTLRRAAAFAGLEEVHFLAESSAAAMGYGLFVAGEKRALVFDMGGGTTDVSIIHIKEGSYEILVTDGHSACGGQDMDTALCQLVTNKILTDMHCGETNHEKMKLRIKKDRILYENILFECRLCKESLSEEQMYSIKLNESILSKVAQCCKAEGVAFVQNKSDLTVIIHRNELEDCVKRVAETAVKVASNAILQYKKTLETMNTDANITTTLHTIGFDIDEVVLVGGSSRVPMVHRLLRDALIAMGFTRFAPVTDGGSGQEFCSSVDPDLVVVEGLAIRAAVLMGHDIPQLKDVLMLDRLCTSIGLLTWEDDICEDGATLAGLQSTETTSTAANSSNSKRYFEPILNRGDVIPHQATKAFRVLNPNQKFVSLDIYEEIENEEEDLEMAPKQGNSYKYQLMGTYDLLIPVCTSTSPSSTATTTTATDTPSSSGSSLMSQCVHAFNRFFEIDEEENENVLACERIVSVTFTINDSGGLSYSISKVVNVPTESGCKRRALSAHKSTQYSILILLFYVGAIVIAYVVAKLYFPVLDQDKA